MCYNGAMTEHKQPYGTYTRDDLISAWTAIYVIAEDVMGDLETLPAIDASEKRHFVQQGHAIVRAAQTFIRKMSAYETADKSIDDNQEYQDAWEALK